MVAWLAVRFLGQASPLPFRATCSHSFLAHAASAVDRTALAVVGSLPVGRSPRAARAPSATTRAALR